MMLPGSAKPARRITAEQLARAALCNRHAPQLAVAVQPHGVFLHLVGADLSIDRVSENALDLTGRTAPELLGQPVYRILGGRTKVALRAAIAALESDGAALDAAGGAGRRQLRFEVHGATGQRFPTEGICYRCGNGYAIELEAACGDVDVPFPLQDRLWSRVAEYAGPSAGLASVVCECIREITGFDRAYFCEFDEQGDGFVPGEARNDRYPSLLEHHFPRSDIPESARRIFVRNRFRLIADVDATPVPILAGDPGGPTLDLSLSMCRAPAPSHLEYLRNMQVRASASFSLVREGRLDGLFGVHHHVPRLLGLRQLAACQRLVELYRNRYDCLRAEEDRAMRSRWADRVRDLVARMESAESDPASFVRTEHGALAELMDADDLLVRLDGQTIVGSSLPADRAHALLDFAAERVNGDATFATHFLAELAPAFRDIQAAASGVLAVALDRDRRNVFAWIRRERVVGQKWSGDPDEAIQSAGPDQVGPRRSFLTYLRDVKGTSLPWADWHLEAVRRLAHALNQVLAGHYNIRARQAAEAANVTKSEFIASVSHELRSPMHSILGFTDALLARGDALDVTRRALYLETMRASGVRLLNLINDLLDIAKLEAGRMAFEFAPGDLADVVRGAADEASSVCSGKDLRIDIADRRSERRSVFDATRVAQVISNLLDNAIRFSPAGATITVTLDDEAAGGTLLAVRDEGCGVPEHERERIFDKFAQGRGTEAPGAAGLGLAICRAIVHAHGGRIRVENGGTGGATFGVHLPRAPGASGGTTTILEADHA